MMMRCPILGTKPPVGDTQEILVLTPDECFCVYELPIELAHEALTRGWVLLEDLGPMN